MPSRILVKLFLLAAAGAFAQSDRGTITGTIADQGDSVIQGAKVTAKHVDTAAMYETVTTETGNFSLPSLPAGNYELTVSVTGFVKYIQTGLTVQVAQTSRLDIKMKVGSTTESITVREDAPLLKTESAEQSQTINGDRINSLPLTSAAGGVRNPVAGVLLAPGVYSPNPGSFTIRVNGGINNTYKTLMDGQDITTSGSDPSHLSELQPSADALEEVTLQSSNFAAEFGQVAGGLINITSRSGTNKFHGSGYEYFTNEALNAGRPYTNTGKNGALLRPRSRNNDFGFTIGGPFSIPKFYNGHNKTFFFFNMEAYRTTSSGSGLTTVPTTAYRSGNFSSVLTGRTLTGPSGEAIPEGGIYDPASNRTENGRIIRDLFPGNIIPLSRFDPVATKIQALLPNPVNGQLINNLTVGDALSRKTYIPSLKIDHYLGKNTKISGYVAEFWQEVPKSGADGLPFPLSPGRIFLDRTPTFRLSLDQTVTPTFLVHLGIGEVRYDHIDSSPESVLGYDAIKELGLVGGGVTPVGFPRLVGLLGSQGGVSSTLGPVNANNYYNDKPTIVWSGTLIRGNHTYKAGGEWRKDIWEDINTRGSQGVYNFGSAQTGLPYLNSTNVGGGSIGFPYASFLLGQVDNATTQNKQDPQIRKPAVGMYLQDTWKLTHKLTLDYGVRWDYARAWKEVHNRTSIFAPGLANPTAGGLLGATQYEGSGPGAHCNCRFGSTYPYAIGPRLGAAYRITSKTVLRAGWGLVYGRTADAAYLTNTPIIGVGYNTLAFTSPSYGEPGAVLKNGLRYNPADLGAATFDPGLRPQAGQLNSPPYYIDPASGRPSRVNQWNISLQRELSRNLIVEAAYVGNRGAWLQGDRMQDWNGLTAEALRAKGFDVNNAADRAILVSPWTSAAAQARGIKAPYAGYPTGATVGQTLRPYPQFGNITSRWTALGNSWYDALQTKVTKRFSHGFDMTGSFTYQKELSLGLDANNDVYNRNQNKYISASSQPLVTVIAFTYKTPGFGANRLLRTAVRDWTVSGVGRYASGLPIQSPGAQNNLNSLLFRANGGSFANRVGGQDLFLKNLNCHCVDPNKDLVLNPAAWTDPVPGQFGTAAAYYNDYRQQRRPSEQFGFGRIFAFRESMSFQLRAEFFNVFNRTEMNTPASANALQTKVTNAQGLLTAGFGYINPGSLFSAPRSGQIIARFQF